MSYCFVTDGSVCASTLLGRSGILEVVVVVKGWVRVAIAERSEVLDVKVVGEILRVWSIESSEVSFCYERSCTLVYVLFDLAD